MFKKLKKVLNEYQEMKHYKISIEFSMNSYLDDWDAEDFINYFTEKDPFIVTQINGEYHKLKLEDVDYGGSNSRYRMTVYYDTQQDFNSKHLEDDIELNIKHLMNDELLRRFGKDEVKISNIIVKDFEEI